MTKPYHTCGADCDGGPGSTDPCKACNAPGFIRGRATQPHQKERIAYALGRAWQETPHLRLGQLLSAVMRTTLMGRSLHLIEDDDLIAGIEKFAKERP
jgi:hypothetical protein